MKFRPLGDRVLIKRMAEREETESGIYKPEAWRDKEQLFTVEAVGPGRRVQAPISRSTIADALSFLGMTELGRAIDMVEALGITFSKPLLPSVKVGDVVLMGRYDGTDVKIDGVDYSIVRDEQILAVLPREKAA